MVRAGPGSRIGVRAGGANQKEAACAVEILVGRIEPLDGELDACLHLQGLICSVLV